MREYSLALRLTSEIVDLRAANADRILPPAATERGPMEGGESKKNRHAIACLFFLEAPPGSPPFATLRRGIRTGSCYRADPALAGERWSGKLPTTVKMRSTVRFDDTAKKETNREDWFLF